MIKTAAAGEDKSPDDGYLPFIDGLRAVAVLSIVAFHVGIPGSKAGYLGVDVFFVISGFLILGAVVRALENGDFSPADFLARRAIRILPALAAVITATIAAAWLFPILPSEFDEILSSARWSALFAANLYFASDTGYFAQAAETKPLLHIWSLAAEEQFYGFVAVLAALLSLGGRLLAIRLAYLLGAAILAVSAALWIRHAADGWEAPTFYLLPWRAWEFLVGGLAALAYRRFRLPALAGWLGLGALAYSLGRFGHSMMMPGALMAVASTALVIMSAVQSPISIANRALSLPPLLAIGRVSYSFYLWHWPVLFFVRTLNLGEAHLPSDIGAALIAFVLACASYRYVEQPFRRWRVRQDPKANARILGAAIAGLILLALAPKALQRFHGEDPAVAAYRSSLDSDDPRAQLRSDEGPQTYVVGKGDPKIVVFGDSQARDLQSGMADFSESTTRPASIHSALACLPLLRSDQLPRVSVEIEPCERLRSGLNEMLDEPPAALILSARWQSGDNSKSFAADLRETLARFTDRNVRVLLVLTVPYLDFDPPECAFRSAMARRPLASCSIDRKTVEKQRSQSISSIKAAVHGLENIRVIDPAELLCDDRVCSSSVGGRVVYRDFGHLNRTGAMHLYTHFADDFRWLAEAASGHYARR